MHFYPVTGRNYGSSSRRTKIALLKTHCTIREVYGADKQFSHVVQMEAVYARKIITSITSVLLMTPSRSSSNTSAIISYFLLSEMFCSFRIESNNSVIVTRLFLRTHTHTHTPLHPVWLSGVFCCRRDSPELTARLSP